MTTAKDQKAQTQPQAPAPPAGFERVGIPDIDGWYAPEVAGPVPVQGKLVGRIRIEDDSGERDVVLVELQNPVKATLDEKDVVLEPGKVLAVGIRYKLRDLLAYVENGGSCWFFPKQKRAIGGGRTMWDFDVYCKGKRAMPPEPTLRTQDDSPPRF